MYNMASGVSHVIIFAHWSISVYIYPYCTWFAWVLYKSTLLWYMYSVTLLFYDYFFILVKIYHSLPTIWSYFHFVYIQISVELNCNHLLNNTPCDYFSDDLYMYITRRKFKYDTRGGRSPAWPGTAVADCHYCINIITFTIVYVKLCMQLLL